MLNSQKLLFISVFFIALMLSFSACSIILDSEALIIPCGSNAECVEELGDIFYCSNGACVPKDNDAGTSEEADAGTS